MISSNEDVTDEEEEENHHDRDVENLDKFFKPSKVLLKVEVERLCGFIHSWFQRYVEFLDLKYSFFQLSSNGLCFRQCICCFREGTNYERFSSITQNLIRLVIKQLYVFKYQSNHVKENEIPPVFLNKNCWVIDSPEECKYFNFESIGVCFAFQCEFSFWPQVICKMKIVGLTNNWKHFFICCLKCF